MAADVLPWHLDPAISRAVAFVHDGTIVVAGGLTATGTTDAIEVIDPSTGQVDRTGRLGRPVHDAAAAILAGRMLVFGGGRSVAGSTVQVVSSRLDGAIVGSLPAARADLATVLVGDRAFIIGGGAGTTTDTRIWATKDGTRMHLVGRLAIGVRYAAVGAIGTSIYVFGGTSTHGDRSEIQRFDTTTGQTSIAGRLPIPLSHASAMVLAGHLLIMGGLGSRAIWGFDPLSDTVDRIGRLPYPVSDAAVVVVADRAYLIGGEDPRRVDTVISVALR